MSIVGNFNFFVGVYLTTCLLLGRNSTCLKDTVDTSMIN